MEAYLQPAYFRPPVPVSGNPLSDFVSDALPDLNSPESLLLSEMPLQEDGTACFIYCMERRKMIYAVGFEAILGYSDGEISVQQYMALTTPRFAAFMHDVAHESIAYLKMPHEGVVQDGFEIELTKFHRLGHELPFISSMEHFESAGNIMKKTLLRLRPNPGMRAGPVIRYAAQGGLEKVLAQAQMSQPAISCKELMLLQQLSEKYEAATQRNGTLELASFEQDAITLLCKRFGVLTLHQLLLFARENRLI